MLTDAQKDWLAVAGLGLAALQTLIALIALVAGRQQEVSKEKLSALRLVRAPLLKVGVILLLTELLILLGVLPFYLEGYRWLPAVALIRLFEMSFTSLALFVIFIRSKQSVVLLLFYLSLLTVSIVVWARWKIPAGIAEHASPADLSMLYRVAVVPFVTSMIMVSFVCVIQIVFRLLKSLQQELYS